MRSHQILSCLFHCFCIQPAGNPVTIQSSGWERSMSGLNVVFVSFFRITVSRVKMRIDFTGIDHANICGQMCINGKHQFFSWYRRIRIKYRHIAVGMYAGICPTGPDDFDFFSCQLCEDFIQFSFDGFFIGLYLPATVIGSIICNNEFKSFHICLPLLFSILFYDFT